MLTPSPPCEQCHGACCTRPGFKSLPELQDTELALFPEAVLNADGRTALPCDTEGNCIHLGADKRCQIYERRPQVCRDFNCLFGYHLGRNRHSFFLGGNPDVVQLIERTYPEFAAFRQEEKLKRPEI